MYIVPKIEVREAEDIADFSTLIQLFQKEPYWGNTDDTIIFDD